MTPCSERKVAPFASMMGFNSWSGTDPYRYAPRKRSPAKRAPPAAEQHFDFPKAFVFGAQKGRKSSERAFEKPLEKPLEKAKHFQSLGLPVSASEQEVRAAYRRLARRYHPDKNQGSAEAAERFREVAEGLRADLGLLTSSRSQQKRAEEFLKSSLIFKIFEVGSEVRFPGLFSETHRPWLPR